MTEDGYLPSVIHIEVDDGWGICRNPNCEEPAHPDSGIHGWCAKHHNEWANAWLNPKEEE